MAEPVLKITDQEMLAFAQSGDLDKLVADAKGLFGRVREVVKLRDKLANLRSQKTGETVGVSTLAINKVIGEERYSFIIDTYLSLNSAQKDMMGYAQEILREDLQTETGKQYFMAFFGAEDLDDFYKKQKKYYDYLTPADEPLKFKKTGVKGLEGGETTAVLKLAKKSKIGRIFIKSMAKNFWKLAGLGISSITVVTLTRDYYASKAKTEIEIGESMKRIYSYADSLFAAEEKAIMAMPEGPEKLKALEKFRKEKADFLAGLQDRTRKMYEAAKTDWYGIALVLGLALGGIYLLTRPRKAYSTRRELVPAKA